MAFKLNINKSGLKYYSIEEFDRTNSVKTCFTTNKGGVSNKEYATLNMGTKTKDKIENIKANYKLICHELNIDENNLVFTDQIHGDFIQIVDRKNSKGDIVGHNRISNTDGLITSNKEVCLVTQYADCVPIYILDTKNEVIALIHSGWRGTVKEIGKKAIDIMKKQYNTDPLDCLAAIGPSIGQCCYEVDQKVIEEFNKEIGNIDDFLVYKDNKKFDIDLWGINKMILKKAGIRDENIIVSEICTSCDKNFFSYRRDKGETGRMAALMELI